MSDLIKRIKPRRFTGGNNTLSLHDDVEKEFPSQEISTEISLYEMCDYEYLRLAHRNLTKDEIETYKFYIIYVAKNTLHPNR
jgi:hypothetical protein